MLIITHKCVIHVNVVDVWIIFCRLDIIVRQLIFGNLNCLNIIMDAVIPVAIMLVSLFIPRFSNYNIIGFEMQFSTIYI
jgi:hypothetical protein